jgi:peptide/nickel transport system permease protein
MQNWLATLKGAKRYPSLVAGVVIIIIFVAFSIYAVVALPYDEAIRLWRGGPGVWDETPRNAEPVWFDLFIEGDAPRTIVVRSGDTGTITEEATGDGMKRVEIVLPFQYDYDGFPTELRLYSEADYEGSRQPATVSWWTPDGRTIILQEHRVLKTKDTYYISQDDELRMQLSGMAPHKGLLVDPNDDEKPLKGEYRLILTTEVPQTAELDAKLVAPGQLHGLAGTDHRGRDLLVALLWGAPIGLMFGVFAAVGAQVSTFVLSAIGTWLGGKVDRLFQWLTQVNLVIPVLPLLILIGHFYSRSLWTMLGMVIALNVFSASYLTYRAMYLQAKEAPYIEAAQAYGARSFRMIFRYLIPRIAPTLLPQFVLIIPLFVFLEATLSVLGLGDPVLPTWGKVIYDAVDDGALYKGYYYWLIEPAVLLLLLGVGFALIGYSLDRIFNPRLRTL